MSGKRLCGRPLQLNERGAVPVPLQLECGRDEGHAPPCRSAAAMARTSRFAVREERSREIPPAAAAALEAEFAARKARHQVSPDRARTIAVQLVRCMDLGDKAGAEAIAGRLYRRGSGKDADAVMVWVWELEAAEAGRAALRAWQASAAAWRDEHQAGLLAPLRDLIRVLAEADHYPAARPAAGGPLADVIAVLAEALNDQELEIEEYASAA